MIKTKLELAFRDEAGKKFTISIDSPREDLTEGEVSSAMEDIVDKEIFATPTGDVVALDSARLISTTVEELDVL